MHPSGSNNTNKLSPQELSEEEISTMTGSNNTNKLSPQEQGYVYFIFVVVQIIQINLVLKNEQNFIKTTEWFK